MLSLSKAVRMYSLTYPWMKFHVITWREIDHKFLKAGEYFREIRDPSRLHPRLTISIVAGPVVDVTV